MISGEELAAYAAGEADPGLVARVESALVDDPVLEARLARLREVDALLGDFPSVRMTDAEADRLAAAVDRDLAVLADGVDVAGASVVDGHAGTDGHPVPAGTDHERGDSHGDVVDLATGRGRRTSSHRRSWWDWAEPGRLAGAAAALVVVIGVVAIGVNGLGTGGNDSAEVADMAAGGSGDAASTATEDSAETMMDLPSATDDQDAGRSTAADSSTEPANESAADSSTESATESFGGVDGEAAADLPVIDDGRVVATVDDVDPTALRDRLGSLVDLDALEEPAVAAAPTEGAHGTEEGGDSTEELVADGQVSTVDHERVVACLPVPDGQVMVAEVITLAPQREAVLYVLADRVVVVDAGTCGEIAELTG